MFVRCRFITLTIEHVIVLQNYLNTKHYLVFTEFISYSCILALQLQKWLSELI